MRKLLTLLIAAASLSAFSQGTLRREIVTTSAFSRRALTNETASGWRDFIGLTGGTNDLGVLGAGFSTVTASNNVFTVTVTNVQPASQSLSNVVNLNSNRYLGSFAGVITNADLYGTGTRLPPNIPYDSSFHLGFLELQADRTLQLSLNGSRLTNLNASELRLGTIPFTRAGSFTNHNDVSVSLLSAGHGMFWDPLTQRWTNGPASTVASSGTFNFAALTNTPPPIVSLGTNNANTLSNLNASSLASGTIANARLSDNYLSALVGNQTVWDGSQSQRTFTFNLSGATDPQLNLANNSMALNVPLTLGNSLTPIAGKLIIVAEDGTSSSVTNNASSGFGFSTAVNAPLFAGSGALLTSLNATELRTGLVDPRRLSDTNGTVDGYSLTIDHGTNKYALITGGSGGVTGMNTNQYTTNVVGQPIYGSAKFTNNLVGSTYLQWNGTNLLLNSGSITSNIPALDLIQTWNNSGTTFTGLRFNVTNTASASGSLLMDLQEGGISYATIKKDGSLTLGPSGSSPTLSLGSSASFNASSLGFGAAAYISWSGRTTIYAPAANRLRILQNDETAGAQVEMGTGIATNGFVTSLGGYTNKGIAWLVGTGSPEGAVVAPIGSIYSRSDGGTDTALLRKETGTGNTGWVAVSSAAGGSGATNLTITPITGGSVALTTQRNYFFTADGTETITLPSAATNAGSFIFVHSKTNTDVVFATVSSQTINRRASPVATIMQNQNDGVIFVSDGTNWFSFVCMPTISTGLFNLGEFLATDGVDRFYTNAGFASLTAGNNFAGSNYFAGTTTFGEVRANVFVPTNTVALGWSSVTNPWAGPTNALPLAGAYDQFYKTLVPLSITNISGYYLTNRQYTMLEVTNASSTNIIVWTPASWIAVDGTNFHTIPAARKARLYVDAAPDSGTNLAFVNIGDIIGTTFVDTGISNSLAAGDTVLRSATVSANLLGANGNSVEFYVGGTFAANGNLKQIKVTLASQTVFDSSALGFNSGAWDGFVKIVRSGANAVECDTHWGSSSTLLASTVQSAALTVGLATNNTLVVTTVNQTVDADNDVVCRLWKGKLEP